jgi:hypothetical protein
MINQKILLPLTLITCFIATPAKADRVTSMACQTGLSLKDGARLTYNISGQIRLTNDDELIGNSTDNNLVITISRRERNGQERYLRYQEKLNSWFSDAPDADYRPLLNRFSSSVKSSLGELYYVVSADNGIYIGVTRKYPLKIQVVHFLNKARTSSARSDISRCSVAQG